jgi:hypothetical protein
MEIGILLVQISALVMEIGEDLYVYFGSFMQIGVLVWKLQTYFLRICRARPAGQVRGTPGTGTGQTLGPDRNRIRAGRGWSGLLGEQGPKRVGTSVAPVALVLWKLSVILWKLSVLMKIKRHATQTIYSLDN